MSRLLMTNSSERNLSMPYPERLNQYAETEKQRHFPKDFMIGWENYETWEDASVGQSGPAQRVFKITAEDIVSYNRSALPDEGATTGPTAARLNISIFDMIGGHCGPRPGPNWQDVTGPTIDGGTYAVWTLLPYLEAGYTP